MYTQRSARSLGRWCHYAAAAALFCAAPAMAEGLQKLNLPTKPGSARFTMPSDRVWSSTVGAPRVTLWEGDRLASMSINIDDNKSGDVNWWLQQQQRTGLKFTWFLITNDVGGNGEGGTWAQWNNVHNAGNSIQSHTANHIGGGSYVSEYETSIAAIENNIPGGKVRTLAYPNGDVSGRTVAAQYFQAARGTTGTPNKANEIDYFNVNSSSGAISSRYVNSVLYGKNDNPSDTHWLNSNSWKHGWLNSHFHGTGEVGRTTIAAQLDYVVSKQDDLWFSTFEDIIRYGQERDTAKISVLENTASVVRFNLTDDMSDELYDFALTIKMKLDPTWENAAATQNGLAIPLTTVANNGSLYALISAVPDAGEVSVVPAAAVPEPAMLAAGFAGAALLLKRRRPA